MSAVKEVPTKLTNAERKHIKSLMLRYKYIGERIDGMPNRHHPGMAYLVAEEAALRWAIQTLTGERIKDVKI